MKKHFVKFLSAGTFCSEETIKEISDWNVDEAVNMSEKVVERYNSKPYGFYFFTKERKDNELDSKITNKSNMYYINGKVQTLEELKKENNPNNKILISNMECNGWDKVVTTYNPWKWTQPLYDGDIVLVIK